MVEEAKYVLGTKNTEINQDFLLNKHDSNTLK